MQRVRLIITGRSGYAAGDRFEVFGDGGSGQIDYDHPLTDRPVPFWPEAVPRRGHLLDGHLELPHAEGTWPDGHLEGVHLLDDHGRPSAPVMFDTPEYVFGAFTHGVRPVDRLGNVFGGEPSETTQTINSSPPRPFNFSLSAFDEATGQAVFSFGRGG